MQNLEKINEFSSITTYIARNNQKVYEVLKQLKIEDRYFAILVNGHRVHINDSILPEDEIIVLPKIAGG